MGEGYQERNSKAGLKEGNQVSQSDERGIDAQERRLKLKYVYLETG